MTKIMRWVQFMKRRDPEISSTYIPAIGWLDISTASISSSDKASSTVVGNEEALSPASYGRIVLGRGGKCYVIVAVKRF